MASRYELSEGQREKIHGLLPVRKKHVGRMAIDNRTFVNDVLWVLWPGARWSGRSAPKVIRRASQPLPCKTSDSGARRT